MFEFGQRIVTRDGEHGAIVRRISGDKSEEYLVSMLNGTQRIVLADELRPFVEDYKQYHLQWTATEGERRLGERRGHDRRQIERRHPERVTPGRRVMQRRQDERRWQLSPSGESLCTSE